MTGSRPRLAALAAMAFCLGIWAGTAVATEPFEEGRLFRPDGSSLSLDEFGRLAGGYDYILIGETHDSRHHHRMQGALLEAAAQAGLRPAVGFEMLYSRNQGRLESFNRREIKLDQLEEASGWTETWSYPLAIYASIFEVAERFDLPVYGLNISKATIDMIKAQGFDEARRTAPPDQWPDLPDVLIQPPDGQLEYLSQVRRSFAARRQNANPAGESPKEAPKAEPPAGETPGDVPKAEPPAEDASPRPFFLVQSLWDTSMAESAIRAHEKTGRPVVIIAGGGHVSHGHGIAHRIDILSPGRKILKVMPLSSPFEPDDPRRAAADVFYASRPSILSLGVVLKGEPKRVVIDELEAGGRAEAAGLKIGDRVLSLEGEEMESPGDFHSAMAIADLADKRQGLAENRVKPLVVERDGTQVALSLR